MTFVAHLKSLSSGQWLSVAVRAAVFAFVFRVLYLLVVNMGLTIRIFGPLLTIAVLWLTSMTLWFAVESVADILNPRVSPQGEGAQETTPNSSPEVRHLQGDTPHV